MNQWNVRPACSPVSRRPPQPRAFSQPAASDCCDWRVGADTACAASSGWQQHVLKVTSSALLTAALMLAAPDAAVAAALQPKAVPAAATKQLRATLHEAWGEPCKLLAVLTIQTSPAPMQPGSVSSLQRGVGAKIRDPSWESLSAGVVKDLYLDASFNRLDWDKVLQASVAVCGCSLNKNGPLVDAPGWGRPAALRASVLLSNHGCSACPAQLRATVVTGPGVSLMQRAPLLSTQARVCLDLHLT